MKRILLSFFTLIICIYSFSFYAIADETDDELILAGDIENSTEYPDLISYKADILRQMHSLVQIKAKDSLPTDVDFTKAVKVMPLADLDSPEAVKTAKDSRSYYYRVPLLVDTGYVYSTFVISDGKVSGYDTSITYDTTMGQVTYLFDEDVVRNLFATVDKKVTDVAVLTIPEIKADFVYFSSGGEAFAIPFASRPDFWELDNGKIYKYEELAKCAKALLNEMSGEYTFADNVGGGGAVNRPNNNRLFTIMPLAILSSAFVVLMILTAKRKASSLK